MTQELPSSLLECLLLTPCLLPGKTSFKEEGVSISIKPEEGETILFFNIDDQANKSCPLRKILFREEQGEKICDLIVFYAKKDERFLCFIELKNKSDDLKNATEKLINTYEKFKTKINPKDCYKPKAFFCTSGGSVPQEHAKYQKQLNETFSGNYGYSKGGDKFGDFLRNSKSGYKHKDKPKK